MRVMPNLQVCLTVLVCCANARASTVLEASATASACIDGLCNIFPAGPSPNSVGIGAANLVTFANVTVNSSASASPGHLDGSISIERDDERLGLPGGPSSIIGQGTVGANFRDSATLSGAANIAVRPTFFINPTNYVTDGANGVGNVNEYFLSPFEQQFSINGMYVTSGQTFIIPAGTYDLLGGLVIGFGDLDIFPLPPADPVTPSTGVEFLNVTIVGSADFYLDVLTPGATITTESGHDYSSTLAAVPEPGYGWLLVLLMMVGIFCHQKKKLTGGRL